MKRTTAPPAPSGSTANVVRRSDRPDLLTTLAVEPDGAGGAVVRFIPSDTAAGGTATGTVIVADDGDDQGGAGAGGATARQDFTVTFASPAAAGVVAGRYVFYNNSAFDGHDPSADAADDAAIAADKQPLLPGDGTATFANYT